jgi:hypothetical protein
MMLKPFSDVLDVVYIAGIDAFGECDDARFHLRRRQPAVTPEHGDDGHIDRRKDVDRHSQNRDDAEDQHEDRRADERVWTPEREMD